MNISPNTNGLIDEATIARISEFKVWVDKLNGNELIHSEKVKVIVDSFRGNAKEYSPEMIIDGDYETYFATNDSIKNTILELDLGDVQEIAGFIIQEYVPLGQRVDGYSIECRVDEKWIEVFSGQKIGYKRIILEGRASAKDIKFPETNGVRLKINNALACPLISTFQVVESIE
ncbi:MAG: hypothetical protein DRJ07_07160 [Bacteroidetes bacterium]|nr:MAG: hypothetical protein DRJ07_07160 [Bacteroidota bacterium]